jgi:hypothetical protein
VQQNPQRRLEGYMKERQEMGGKLNSNQAPHMMSDYISPPGEL